MVPLVESAAGAAAHCRAWTYFSCLMRACRVKVTCKILTAIAAAQAAADHMSTSGNAHPLAVPHTCPPPTSMSVLSLGTCRSYSCTGQDEYEARSSFWQGVGRVTAAPPLLASMHEELAGGLAPTPPSPHCLATTNPSGPHLCTVGQAVGQPLLRLVNLLLRGSGRQPLLCLVLAPLRAPLQPVLQRESGQHGQV